MKTKVKLLGLTVSCALFGFFLGAYFGSPLLTSLRLLNNTAKRDRIDSGWWKEERKDSEHLKAERDEYKKSSDPFKRLSKKYLGMVDNLEQLEKELNNGSYFLFSGNPQMLGGSWKILNPYTSELLWIVSREQWMAVPVENKRWFLVNLYEDVYRIGAGETATINVKSSNGEWLGQVSNHNINFKIR